MRQRIFESTLKPIYVRLQFTLKVDWSTYIDYVYYALQETII